MKFEQLSLSSELLRAVQLLGYDTVTPIQEQVIPEGLKGQDLLVKSRTGSGKTAAFGLVLTQLVKWELSSIQALVLVPTRELALQVASELKNLSRFKRLNVLPVYGKSSLKDQLLCLKQRTHIVVATPGRFLDLMQQEPDLFAGIKHVVLDEADEMFFIGLRDTVEQILNKLPSNLQMMLFSATLSDEIKEVALPYVTNPKELILAEETETASSVIQYYISASEGEKKKVLLDYLIVNAPLSAMIFTNTQKAADDVCDYLTSRQVSCCKLHGGMFQKERIKTINSFKNQEFRYLIATDVAARGIDVTNVSVVINYDLPNTTQAYVHRIGRTGRCDCSGLACTLLTPEQEASFLEILTETRAKILRIERDTLLISNEQETAFLKLQETKEESRPKKEEKIQEEIKMICIRAGKQDKIRACEIVATICSLPNMTPEDIGVIQILKNLSFVEILNKKAEYVLTNLPNQTLKGKRRKVELAKKN